MTSVPNESRNKSVSGRYSEFQVVEVMLAYLFIGVFSGVQWSQLRNIFQLHLVSYLRVVW